MKNEEKKAVRAGEQKTPGKAGKVKAQVVAQQTEMPIESPVGGEPQEDTGLNRKGVWEVTYESGAIIGYFEGTPKRIAAFLIHRLDEGKYIKELSFRYISIQSVPEVLMREDCCGKRYKKMDNFCSRCGKNLRIDLKLPPKVKLNVSLPRKAS